MINAKQFIKALDELEGAKGISKESIILALKEAMEKAFVKQLGMATKADMEDAKVRVDIDAKKGTIEMYILKNIVAEVEDDYLEISLEDANQDGGVYQIGDIYEIPVSTDELTKLAAQNVKSVLKQKISEAEKQAIFEAYSDKIGEMIQGIVEKVDERSTIVNIGRTSVYLPNNQKIPGETFRIGEQIRLYIKDVQSTTKGAQIIVSRSDAGYLKRLFEEEITEIYEGIVMIKDIAREAGERSKIAVISDNPNIDPIGACIGPNGSRIQKICASLGNTKEKEKIDVIAYYQNPGLYIIEALKPANVVGVVLYENEKRAVAVVRNNELSLAIGKRGVNARLAVRLTGWNIDIKEQDEAMRMGLVYLSSEDLRRQDELKKMQKVTDLFEEDHYEEMTEEEPLQVETIVSSHEQTPSDDNQEDKVEEKETVAEETTVVEEPKEETTVVHTKVKLADLEKELEDEKKRRDRQAQYASRRKKSYRDESENENEEETQAKPASSTTYMPIYTQEELDEMDEEEQENDIEEDDDIDYDDFDSYYDDNR